MRRPLLARSDASVRPRMAEGLPVIGMIASTFSRARRHPLLHIVRPHLGVDVAAPSGTRISAPAAGRVTFVGRRFAVGLVVEIDHGKGVTTRYAHCRATLVKEGDMVTPGMAIATVGSSGLSTGPHLHYEVLVRGVPVDPLRYRMSQAGDSATAVGGAAGSAAGQGAGSGHLGPVQEGAPTPDASAPAPGSGPS
jgi:murein DD-endopeptidase MepM/ murein hydrolase activator NlpD